MAVTGKTWGFAAFLLVSLFVFDCAILPCSAQAKNKEDMHCKELIVEGVKKAMKEVSKCTQKLGLKTKQEKKEKAACIMKCVAINIGLLDQNGAIDEKMVMVFVDENIPSKYHDAAFTIMADCIHHAGSLDPTEESCKSYDPVFKCATESATKFAKLCSEMPN